jgi:hypothetical protein
MRLLGYVVAAASVVALSGSAFAATVASIEGSVKVNTGSGYHVVSGTTEVKPGGSVMVGPGGKAEILYSDGCRTPVTPGAVSVVAPVSPCAQGQAYPGYGNGNDYSTWLGYGLALGAGIGIGAAIWSGQHGNTVVVAAPPPASP